MSDGDISKMMMQKEEEPIKLKPPKKIIIPRRAPSVVIPEREVVYFTADKTTCVECTCYPKEEPYKKPKPLLQCQRTPLTLYELAADVVDKIPLPEAFDWSEAEVAQWMELQVGLPEYRECIFDNHIDGMRLLMLEDPSKLPPINIRQFEHIKIITAQVRKLYSTDFVEFLRSIGLPPRRPLVHTTWFKSRTGPSWGIRQNWTRSGILRWMKILMPEPVHRDHWDLVWYQKPDFPSVKFARVPPIFVDRSDYMKKPRKKVKPNLVQRKFILDYSIPKELQKIFMPEIKYERFWAPEVLEAARRKMKEFRFLIKEDSRLYPQKINTEGLKGRELNLARRKMPKPKFLVMKYAK